MRGTVAEQRRADFDIPVPLLRVWSHIRGVDAERTRTRSGCGAEAGASAISWGQRWFGASGIEADAENWVLDPFVAEQILFPLRDRSATTNVWTHVMICVEANFPPASARFCSAHVWTYLKDNSWGVKEPCPFKNAQSFLWDSTKVSESCDFEHGVESVELSFDCHFEFTHFPIDSVDLIFNFPF